MAQGWQFWIDRGGTFTDVIGIDPEGVNTVFKLLSVDPKHYADPCIEGINRVRRQSSRHANAPIQTIKMGTTVATNALLEHRGAKLAFVTTHGFEDSLEIAYQDRPSLFTLAIQKAAPLYHDVVGIIERISAKGEVILALDENQAEAQLQKIFDDGIRVLAIALMHGYRYPQHEARIATIAESIGFDHVFCSHLSEPVIKLIRRANTTVIDAYLTPLLQNHIKQLHAAFPDSLILFMQSNGRLAQAASFQGRHSILSGPAGGVVGAVDTAKCAGFDKVIAFDMGGTSTDVSHYHQKFEYSRESSINGIKISIPMMKIHTIAAGGGSILSFEEGRLQVGPRSAGASPGPACYGNQGPLTITDANLLLGKLQPAFFPAIFGEQQNAPLDKTIVEKKFLQLSKEINRQSNTAYSIESLAEAFLQIAIQNMANAVKTLSTQRGFELTDYILNCFGGAGAQHACLLAEALEISTVFIPPQGSVLSAYGIGMSRIGNIQTHSIQAPLDTDTLNKIQLSTAALKQQFAQNIVAELKYTHACEHQVSLLIKHAGSDHCIAIDYDSHIINIVENYHKKHQQYFGFKLSDTTLIIDSIAVSSSLSISSPKKKTHFSNHKTSDVTPTFPMYSRGRWREVKAIEWSQLAIKTAIDGPALIVSPHTSVVIEDGWQAHIDDSMALLIQRTAVVTTVVDTEQADPMLLEIFNNALMNIAEQMGAVLTNTASSVNIKERHDYSCAIFDTQGQLLANAPHIPVHLGSMGESVKTLIADKKAQLSDGDVYMSNDPYHGGTHLPDITVISPLFFDGNSEPLFYLASRGHHADIGGLTPGSLPANSKKLSDEGIVFDNVLLTHNGLFNEDTILSILTVGGARKPDQNIADLKAQIAANRKGIQELKRFIAQYGLDFTRSYVGFILDNGALAVQKALASLNDGQFECPMDNGAKIVVKVSIDKKTPSATIDFSGTSKQLDNNFNAPASITKACVLYVLRTLVNKAIPLNDGCLRPIKLMIPAGSLLNPNPPAAVVAGNVETSQCVVDCLYGALQILAASQGTMNNLCFGNKQYQYYETLCGGTGAGEGFAGASAVHSHMTNSWLTDPEVLEQRFPVQIESFAIRKNSGGKGQWCGGDGVSRRIRFLQAMTLTLLTNRRFTAPFGIMGGCSGSPGSNQLLTLSGETIELGSSCNYQLSAGDTVIINTPGGGGYGKL